MNRHFSKEDTQVDNKHTKGCSVVREMQLTPTKRYPSGWLLQKPKTQKTATVEGM